MLRVLVLVIRVFAQKIAGSLEEPQEMLKGNDGKQTR
jgi:hypothetical protein